MDDNQEQPLAELLRPKNVNDIIGQSELMGEGQPLKVAIESGNLPSMILWGPKRNGKTTIDRLIANTYESEYL